jgi:hypothetical protein
MRFYSVHAPPGQPDLKERFRFVKDGFSWPALLVPLPWLLWHRLWLALVWYVVFVLVVAWAGRLGGEDLALYLAVIGTVFLALQANDVRRAALDRRGWEEVGTSFGKDIVEAEARFFAERPVEQNPLDRRAAMLRAAYAPQHRLQAAEEQVIGSFPEPERP